MKLSEYVPPTVAEMAEYRADLAKRKSQITDEELLLIADLRALGHPKKHDTVTFEICGQKVAYEWIYDSSDPLGYWMLKK